MKCFYETRSRGPQDQDFDVINLKIIFPGNRTRDFTVVGRYNYRYAVNAFIKLDESIHGVTVVIRTNDREIPVSTPGRFNLQIKIISACSLALSLSLVRSHPHSLSFSLSLSLSLFLSHAHARAPSLSVFSLAVSLYVARRGGRG